MSNWFWYRIFTGYKSHFNSSLSDGSGRIERVEGSTDLLDEGLDLVFLHRVLQFYLWRRRMGSLECSSIIFKSIKLLLRISILSLGLMTSLINSKGQATFLRLTWDRGIPNLGWEVRIYQKRHLIWSIWVISNVLWSHLCPNNIYGSQE